MVSRIETVEKARRVRDLLKNGFSPAQISKKISKCSIKLIEEYSEANSHGKSCKVCGGVGISKNRTTGQKRPLCTEK